MLGDRPEIEVTLSDKFWAWCADRSTMYCVLRERGVTKAMLTHEPGHPRYRLRFPGVGFSEAPEFDRQVDENYDAIKVIDGTPEDLELLP